MSDERKCPNCGLDAWQTITPARMVDGDRAAAEVAAAEKKVADKRGALLRCACGYETREKDELVPATE
jgi:hypothetical protein